jgi:hypothetical protein
MTDFGALLTTLSQSKVEFMVIGGAAALAHGSARFTQDLDILYDRTPENIERLVTALKGTKPYLRDAPPGLPFLWDKSTLLRGLNFTLTTSLGEIDLFGEIPGGGSYQDLKAGAIWLNVFQIQCLCLSVRQLIRAKRATGRAKDLEVLAELEALASENDPE